MKHSGDNICNKFHDLYPNASPGGWRDRLKDDFNWIAKIDCQAIAKCAIEKLSLIHES